MATAYPIAVLKMVHENNEEGDYYPDNTLALWAGLQSDLNHRVRGGGHGTITEQVPGRND